MHERVAVFLGEVERGLGRLRSEPYEWFVLVGNRLVLAGLLTSAFAFSVLALMAADVVDVRNATEMLYVFQVLVGGNLTLLTIVLSINQLVLSREFKTPGELQEQIRNVIAYRDDVEETTDRDAVPVTPSGFLFVLLAETQDTAERLDELIEKSDHDQFSDEVRALLVDLVTHTDETKAVLDRSQRGIFSALVVTLETNYSHQLNEVQRLQTAHEGDLPPDVLEAFDELRESLKQVDIARQYFKSIYMQSELAVLSQVLLFVGLPAVGSALLALLVYAGATGTPIGVNYLEVLVPLVVTLGFSPLALLFAYVLRIATVAQLTVAITPFTTPAQETELGHR